MRLPGTNCPLDSYKLFLARAQPQVHIKIAIFANKPGPQTNINSLKNIINNDINTNQFTTKLLNIFL